MSERRGACCPSAVASVEVDGRWLVESSRRVGLLASDVGRGRVEGGAVSVCVDLLATAALIAGGLNKGEGLGRVE
jgi:hypothetical protein